MRKKLVIWLCLTFFSFTAGIVHISETSSSLLSSSFWKSSIISFSISICSYCALGVNIKQPCNSLLFAMNQSTHVIPRSKCRAPLIVDKNCDFISVPCIFSAVTFYTFLNAVYFVFDYFLGKIFSRSFIRTPASAISPKKSVKYVLPNFITSSLKSVSYSLNYSLCFNFCSVRI